MDITEERALQLASDALEAAADGHSRCDAALTALLAKINCSLGIVAAKSMPRAVALELALALTSFEAASPLDHIVRGAALDSLSAGRAAV